MLLKGGIASLADGPLPIGEATLAAGLVSLFGDDIAAAISVITDVENLSAAMNPMQSMVGGKVSSGGALPPPDDDDGLSSRDQTAQLQVSGSRARANLKRDMRTPSGQQAHHLIPWQHRTHPVVQQAAKGGFNMNGRVNGMNLGPGKHLGSHPKYNRIMGRWLDRYTNKGLTNREAAVLLRNHAARARRLINQSTTKLR